MHPSVLVELGVSVRVNLSYNTIKTIQKLFKNETKQYTVFIHGIRDFPVDYSEHDDCFDATILDTLETANCEEEFNAKLVSIANEVMNIKDISFEFFNRFSSVDVDFNDSDSNTSYETVGSAYYFAKCITERVDDFKALGFNEDMITISTSNTIMY